MQRVLDFVIGALLAVWWGYWVGHECYVDAPWKIWIITLISGMGVMFMAVESRAAMRDARQRRQEVPQQGGPHE